MAAQIEKICEAEGRSRSEFVREAARTCKVHPALIISTEVLSIKTGKYFLAMITSAQQP